MSFKIITISREFAVAVALSASRLLKNAALSFTIKK